MWRVRTTSKPTPPRLVSQLSLRRFTICAPPLREHGCKATGSRLFIDSSFLGAAVFAHVGMIDEAKRWAERGIARLAATPGGALAIAEGRIIQALLDVNPFRRQEDKDHFADGMRRAGIPG